MKILVIEDEILILKSLQKLLERQGMDVVTTPSGREGIELIGQYKFDRIICDLMLKDISGFDIIESSKKLYSEVEISELFIIITAYSSPQVLNQAGKYNCLIINKPFKNIHEAIDTFIQGKNGKKVN